MTNSLEHHRRTFLQASLAAGAGMFAGGTLPAFAAENERPAVTKKLRVLGKTPPMNAEPALPDLVKGWITPLEHFYVRSHAANPKIDPRQFRVKVEGLVEKPLTLSLGELSERFKKTEVVATMTCAGNRRTEHSRKRKVKGVQWSEGAIGNAKWGGARLSDVLKMAGVKPDAKHVWFEGLDEIERKGGTIPFGGSIPLVKAFADSDTVPGALLCSEMNGRALLPDHGFPLRTVVPGYIGARSVKWLGRIVVSNRPSPNHYLDHAYKLVEKDDDLLWAESAPIYAYRLNSVICTPTAGAKIDGKTLQVAGYALAPGRAGRTISRVELSADGGRTWRRAKLTSEPKPYCWQLWSAEIPIAGSTRRLIVRAFDSAGNGQPRSVPWNLKGYLYNAWHRVPVKAQ